MVFMLDPKKFSDYPPEASVDGTEIIPIVKDGQNSSVTIETLQQSVDVITDHGQLSGLSDDDHTQYALADGSRGNFATPSQGALADSALQNISGQDLSTADNTTSAFITAADVPAETDPIFSSSPAASVTSTDITNLGNLDSAAYEPSTVFAPALGVDDNYVTDAEKTVISNTSGTNTGDNATNSQYSGLAASKQDKDPTLTALAAHNTNGLLTQTAPDTFAGRTITGTSNQVTVTNGDGVSGNPTLSLPQDIHTGATPTFAGATLNGTTTVNGTLAVNNSGTISNFTFKNTGAVDPNNKFQLNHYSKNDAGVEKQSMLLQTRLSGTVAGAERTQFVIQGYVGGVFQTLLNLDYGLMYAPGGLDTSGNSYIGGHIISKTDSAYNLGDSTHYWSNTYTKRVYFNSTNYVTGEYAGVTQFVASGTGNVAEFKNTVNDTKFTLNAVAGKGSFSILSATADYRAFVADGGGKLYWRIGNYGSNSLAFRTNSDGYTGYLDALALTIDGSQKAKFFGDIESADKNIILGTATGTKIGTATNQKLSFFNATPIVQPSATPANATDLATALTLVNDLKSKLISLGLIA